MLNGKKIIIGISGSIAAYKIPFLVRLLKKEGAEVQVILSPYAHEFVTSLTLSTLSERPVLTEFYEKGSGSWHSHVDLGLWADLILVAPLTANTMAKMATGVADNLLLTTLLSARCPVYYAPAMDLDMYKHPTTQANISTLNSFGYKLIEPAEGELASGLRGMGRLEEPENILAILKKEFGLDSAFYGKRVMVSAGPTHEAIDPVRFIGNHSSGKMGTAIAMALANSGAKVDLVLGPVNLDVDHPNITVQNVTSAEEMYVQCTRFFADADLGIMTAAVADFKPVSSAKEKIKKESGLDQLKLEPTKDILAELGRSKKEGQLLVGFALETAHEEQHAQKKLQNKNLDLIVLNSLKDEGAGFGYDTNKVTLITKAGYKTVLPLKSKAEVANDILSAVEGLMR
jgi:phosphopantothenoylcysteine decarboxylase/phosphopantothenate--cysteine ligase